MRDDSAEYFGETSCSERLMFPTRRNMDRLLRGESVLKSQFPDVTGPETSIEEIGRGFGHPEWVGEVKHAQWGDRRNPGG
jgi:hypothetical protein